MFDGYSVLIRLTLQNQVSAGLIGMSAQFTRLQAQATALQARLAGIRTMALTGLGMAAVGFTGLYLIDKALKPAEEYAHQLNIMNMAGVKQADIASSIGLAWKTTSQVITTTATDNLRMLNDMRIVFGEMGQAQMALPLVAQMQAVLMSSKEGKSIASDKDFAFSVAKALDIIGAVKNKDEFMIEANAMAKTVTAFQGRVTPKMFQSTFAYARQAKYAMDDEFKYQYLPTLMMEYSQGTGGAGGGSRGVGPMIAAMYRMTNQGYINKKSLPELERVGLVPKNSDIKTTTSGTTVGPMTNYQLAGKDPFQWVQQTLLPILQKNYGHDGKPLTREELQFHINQLFRGNQLAASLLTEFAVKPYAFLRDQKLIQQADTPEKAYQKALIADPVLARTALSAQWTNLQTALTVPLVTVLIPALMTLANIFNSLGRILQEYPMLATTLSYAFLGLSASLAFGGVVLLLSAAFSALSVTASLLLVPLTILGAPLIGIAAAFALIAYGAYKLWQTLKSMNWGALAGEFQTLWNVFKQTTTGKILITTFQLLWTVLKNNPISLAIAAFQQLFSIISSGVAAVVGGIRGMLGMANSDLSHLKTMDGQKSTGTNTYQLYGAPIIPGMSGTKSTAIGKPSAMNNQHTTIQVASNIHLDGRQIARIVTDHQVKNATRSPNYSQGFDPNMSPTPMVLKGNIA